LLIQLRLGSFEYRIALLQVVGALNSHTGLENPGLPADGRGLPDILSGLGRFDYILGAEGLDGGLHKCSSYLSRESVEYLFGEVK
jgi:hypothetical protein